ncbi:MAG: hypothetical protein OMM_03740 [Candidatus Magnetoglobus multicellularis str. Araruama]|uniref:Uncharacterized protein n=1 Tax=Candidatus Magnetoglobus multicellularis str. Araruama TaxID=890399 RepID=A0A1V1P4I9_9BACT|nr:MAG: hypothetical protein OMM_03740 [Candidatus Magnetoglobus multicellularis str. Araruama]
MITKNKTGRKKGIQAYCFLIVFLLIAVPVQAIEWTYYDNNNEKLIDPTPEEIDSTAAMRVSDTGVTQYILEINHDFSGTWGTGYLENIGNPMPDIGKKWVNANEEVTCNVDGIVQDVYNMNSRYITTGYYAQGPPNAKDKASGLIFDGVNDEVRSPNMYIAYPRYINISFSLKRDRVNTSEWVFHHAGNNNTGLYFGFNSQNKAVLGCSHGEVTADTPTDNAWHEWRVYLHFSDYRCTNAWGKSVILQIYQDNVRIAYKFIKPNCWTVKVPYTYKVHQRGCYLVDTQTQLGGINDAGNKKWSECKNTWGSQYGPSINSNYSGHPINMCRHYKKL